MAKCDLCNLQMLGTEGCTCEKFIDNEGKVFDRIRYGMGEETRYINQATHPRCHDCDCRWGNYHHGGCDMENCPVCGGQLMTCGHAQFLEAK